MTSNSPPNFKPIQHLHAHTAPPTCARYSPSGNLLATAGADGVVHLWDTSTTSAPYGHLKSLRGTHTRGINDLCFSANGVYLATASDDGTAVIWSLHSYKPLRTLTGHTSHVLCLAFNPKGNILATGSWDETVILWNVLKGTRIKTLQAHSDPVSSLAFNREGGMIVTGSCDGLISHASFTPNGLYIISFSLSSTIRIWNYHTSKVMKTFTGHRGVKFGSGLVLMDPRVEGCLERDEEVVVEEQDDDAGKDRKRRKLQHGDLDREEADHLPTEENGGAEPTSPQPMTTTTDTTTSIAEQRSIISQNPNMVSTVPVLESAAMDTTTGNGSEEAGDQGGNGLEVEPTDIVAAPLETTDTTTAAAAITPAFTSAEIEPAALSAPAAANGNGTLTPTVPETRSQAPPHTESEPEAVTQDGTTDGIPTAWLLSGTDTEDVFLWDVQSRQCLQRIHTQSYDISDGDRVQSSSQGNGADVHAGKSAAREAETAAAGDVKKDKDAAGREDRPTLALAAHPCRREIAVGGNGGRFGNVVSVWRSS
ncbi:hypothetical protein QFC21_007215 [Naganishia friedmannii]|uniref:Uncharacterized protein n=1 Tax=Naganishia friedmannii TaxID=89922 RepID=A0ACC2UXN7_9TREE|nr:hypothetical protein QFC21_007215 [Naganishia friedmannii]